jgi:hypothetical protein
MPRTTVGASALWNRSDGTSTIDHQSSTTDAHRSTSASIHVSELRYDGAMAIGLSRLDRTRSRSSPRNGRSHRASDLTDDLSDDHPIGFGTTRAGNRDRQLKQPEIVTPNLPLGMGRSIARRHDPTTELGNFLRMMRSTICRSCHDSRGWDRSSHAISPYNIGGGRQTGAVP